MAETAAYNITGKDTARPQRPLRMDKTIKKVCCSEIPAMLQKDLLLMNITVQKVGRDQVCCWKPASQGEEGQFVSRWRAEAAENVSERKGGYQYM